MAGGIYSGLDRYALQSFKGCHDRVRDGKCPSIFWERNREGYLGFCKEIGPKPLDMQKPSVGRIDHSKGYEPENIRWEEHKFNSVKRKGTKFEGSIEEEVPLRLFKFRKGTQGHLDHQRMASIKRWSDPRQREIARKRAKENNPNRRIDKKEK